MNPLTIHKMSLWQQIALTEVITLIYIYTHTEHIYAFTQIYTNILLFCKKLSSKHQMQVLFIENHKDGSN